MLEAIVIVILLLLVYFYATYGRVCSDDLPDAWRSFTEFTKGTTLLEADISEFSKSYDKHSKDFVEARLDKDNEYTRVFYILKDAMNKGKRILTYKDVPHSPKMYEAFSNAVQHPDKFFAELASQSSLVQKAAGSFIGNQSNVSNLGLQVVNDIRPQNRVKFTPPPPSTMWKYIERSRGPH
jgi:hypothetical protein